MLLWPSKTKKLKRNKKFKYYWKEDHSSFSHKIVDTNGSIPFQVASQTMELKERLALVLPLERLFIIKSVNKHDF